MARIFASLCIIGYHNTPALALLYKLPPLRLFTAYVTEYGYLAVDIFFVLSGWLLTRQALTTFERRRDDASFVTRFWVRRWFRTLPSYWIVVILLAVPLTVDLPRTLKHLAFLQTLVLPNLYPVSWSLVADEWFYLLLPVAIVALSGSSRSWLPVSLWFAALILSATLRSIYVTTGQGWLFVLTLPQARLEGLLIGSLLATVAIKRPRIYARMHANRVLLAAAGGFLAIVVLVAGNNDLWWFQVLGLVAFSIGIGAVIPYLAALPRPRLLPLAIVGGITFVSELTYPLYLLHPLIPHWEVLRVYPVVYYTSGFVALFALAVGLHLVVERPFLHWRDRIVGHPQRRQPMSPTHHESPLRRAWKSGLSAAHQTRSDPMRLG